jgi:cell division protein FtsW
MKRTRSVHDPVLTALACAATLIGLLFIFDAGYARSLRDAKGVIPPEFIAQLIALPVALFVGWRASRVRPDKWQKYSKVFWGACIVGLILCKVPGIAVPMNGASRWIHIPGIPKSNIQPAEFAKLAAILYLGSVLATRKAWPSKIAPRKDFAHYMDTIVVPKFMRALPLLWVMIAVVLIEIEPDLGTAAVVGATAAAMIFMGGVSKKSLWACGILCVLGVSALVMKQPYRMERITNHAHRWERENVDDTTYQTVQSEAAMAGGGAMGVGFGNGRAKHVEPATTTDFVMATVAEETGLLGSWLVLAVVGGLSLRMFYLAAQAKEKFQKYVLGGVAFWIGVQAAVNLMMANATLPPIGIPMPFVSSGGSSLMALWMAVGICQAMLLPAAVKGEALAVSDHRRRYRRPHLSSARSRATVR